MPVGTLGAGLAVFIGLLAVEVSTATADSETPQLRRVMTSNPAVSRLLHEGAARSITFAKLLSRFEATSWRVFIERGRCPEPAAVGCLPHFVGRYEGEPYVRIFVDHSRLEHDREISTIAHELQHALEVAESKDVVDTPSLVRRFRLIGTLRVTSRRKMTFETDAAERAGERVLEELLRSPRRVDSQR